MSFKHLFTPHEIRGHEIRNRIFSTAHQTILAKNGSPTDEMAAYHEARARGGAGLIIMESSRPYADDVSESYFIDSSTDACIPGYKKAADAVHKHGTKVFGQINHGGRISRMHNGMNLVSHAPSAVPDHRFHCMPRVMSVEYIHTIINAFAAAAGRMMEAGLDGVELTASHGMLMAQFLNPLTNHREDEYGGSPENRFRFVGELIAATRKVVGEDKVVGMRISAEEIEPDGLDADGWLDICRRLNDEDGLDFINVTVGSMMGLGGSIHVVPPMAIEHAYTAPKAGAINAVVDKSVFVAGRINQPQLAEQVLADGQAHMCGMTRAMISDPEMPNKAREGRLDDIRACIGCNQACIGHYHMGVPISCIQNPQSGRELSLEVTSQATDKKTVIVAGGGPAGMKAAAVAAERGHRVVLHEASNKLGGQVLLAQSLPGRAEFGVLVDNLKREMDLAGVEVKLNSPINRALIDQEKPDTVIVATGAVPFKPDIDIAEDVHAVDVWQVLKGEVNPSAEVVVADWRCDWVGVGVAQKLALEGSHVRLCVDGMHAAQNLQKYLAWHWTGELHKVGVEVIPYARLYGADGDTVYFQHSTSGEPIICEGVDTLVVAQGHAPVTTLEHELMGCDADVHLVGDCLSPRSAEEAIYEAEMAARKI
ncbi:MAG: FAD-dependent oxidoreductase [Rhodospirillales bacterium]|jgi:2,4-dienoyl-CoA reductase-like NADH-dependent reductase (Old Yellow Enzyme family)|nr:FAD-dependent oxidoreductase [Rhodospirillales bacterium]MBT5520517.1 FAD-dependent oxidoreductase [Rhodospirillales bacterium]MBT6110179.1 FAD-dependent oxidoreductase [Rhodospirillales bacterium]MBT7147053.1 FAD-dependent oxidoreductase [Rhodospirillales bacterium]MBT7780112.1 FAD-dependent oxidoreductase [Rhodospirillales bacterium]